MISIVQKTVPTNKALHELCAQGLERVLANSSLGFHQIPQRTDLWNRAQELGSQLNKNFNEMVIVGIGGSSLGPKALSEILGSASKGKKLHFCDNVDPLAFDKLFNSLIDHHKTVWVVISKSGSTIETLVSTDLLFARYQKLNMKPTCVLISEKRKNPLQEWALKNSIQHLEIPEDVGGRYSVLTAVGMLPIAFLGHSVSSLIQGATETLNNRPLVAELSAQFLQSFERQEWISFFWFYGSGFESWGRWLQQLWAESLAKTVDRKNQPATRVSTPMWAIGSSDQHSVLQQVMDGARDKFVVFQRVLEVERAGEKVMTTQFEHQNFFNGHTMGELIRAQAQGTCQALNERQVSTLTIETSGLDGKCLGAQLMLWQLVVASVAEVLDINAFDQPGVELGKRLARQILES